MKVLLLCNVGMSSSILIKKISAAAETMGVELEIASSGVNTAFEEVGKWDVCLTGPQVAYAIDNIRETLNIPVEAVEPLTYALADGEKALKQAIRMYENK